LPLPRWGAESGNFRAHGSIIIPNQVLKRIEYTRIDGGCRTATDRIVRETEFSIRVDGEPFATAMLMADKIKEFVYGHLYIQGVIAAASDVRSLIIENDVADVSLARRRQPSENQVVTSSLKVGPAQVFDCVKAILKSEIFTETEAVHSAGLFLEGSEPICIAEDLGRNHALDKVVGGGVLRDVDFSRTLAASTGRQPTEMISKCRRSGIPIIATKGVPTDLAVVMAREAGVTIAGFVRGDTMIIYSHPERIEGAGE
jgi:FdhD protein